MFYTYAHYRADDKRIFYIGKGCKGKLLHIGGYKFRYD